MKTTYEILGRRCSFDTALPEAMAYVSQLLTPFETTLAADVEYRLVAGSEGKYRLLKDGGELNVSARVSGLIDLFLADSHREGVAAVSDRILIHAAACIIAGRAVLLPAPPDHGKSTLVSALVRAGARYLTDEAVPVRLSDGLVEAYPRPLWLDRGSVNALGTVEPPARWEAFNRNFIRLRAEDLTPGGAASTHPGPVRVGLVISPRYTDGGRLAFEPVSKARGLVLLAENSFNVDRFGAAGVEALARTVDPARCYRMTHDDLEETVEAIFRLAGSPSEQLDVAEGQVEVLA